MKIKTVWSIFFSPSGTTRSYTERIASHFPGTQRQVDMLRDEDPEGGRFFLEDLAVVGVPVFSGRVPAPCVEILKSIQGEGAPAVALAVYGNRDYDDALLELTQLLKKRGFLVIGAAALLARHSIFPQVAADRPDRSDLEKADSFADTLAQRLAQYPETPYELPPIKGNFPYKETGPIPIRPSANSACSQCGLCVEVCPASAIDPLYPDRTDKTRCISCTACMTACPRKVRSFRGFVYRAAAKRFQKACADRKEPDFF